MGKVKELVMDTQQLQEDLDITNSYNAFLEYENDQLRSTLIRVQLKKNTIEDIRALASKALSTNFWDEYDEHTK